MAYKRMNSVFKVFTLWLLAIAYVSRLPNLSVCSFKLSVKAPKPDPPLKLHKIDVLNSPPAKYGSQNLNRWNLYLLEEGDVRDAADLAMSAFYKPRFKLTGNNNLSSFERILFQPLISFLLSVDRLDAWLSNYIGFGNRGGRRLRVPSLEKGADAIILAVTDSASPNNKLVGVVELCMDPANGLLSPPLQSPFRSTPLANSKPYLCNLCVAPEYRRQGLGRFLCQVCEGIAVDLWKEGEMYLHVERENKGAVALYLSMGYEELDVLSERDKRKYNMNDICYFYKDLS